MTASTRYGATPDRWAFWDLTLGLSADLLPVVCRPGAPIAPSSKLTSYGKVPSRYDATRRVMGIPAWTSVTPTDVDLVVWPLEPDYGICLQTRSVRALDVDVPDRDLARAILQTIRETFPFVYWPLRTRADSPKFLVLFQLEGEYPKQVLETEGGMIEFLGNGQQCLVEGTHPAGARYEWNDFTTIPTLSEPEFRSLQATLREWFGTTDWSTGRRTTPRGSHPSVAPASIDDPVVPYLTATGWTVSTSADGRVHVRCPWAADHTAGSDPTASTYFPAGTGGFEQGHFTCLHAHCTHRTTAEFLDQVGWMTDGFEVVELPTVDPDARHVLEALGVDDLDDLIGRDPAAPASVHPADGPHFDRDLKSGKIKPTLPNLVAALSDADWCGVSIARDEYKDLLVLGTADAHRPFKDADYTDLMLRLIQRPNGFVPAIPTQTFREAVNYVSTKNAFDSAINWLNGLPPWDGRHRVDGFCRRYLGAAHSAYATAISRYWWSAHAGRILQPGIQADMAIVLISSQGTGKTSAIKAMVPGHEHYVELSLTDRDQDLSRSMRGKLIGEIAELRGINSRDHEAIKAWVSRQREEWVPKYMEFSQTFPRRLVLVGTSNQEEFLADETGNRRWLPLHVGSKQDRAAIEADRDQLWAEARVLFCTYGILWEDAERLAKREHHRFKIQDAWEETIREWLDTPSLRGTTPSGYPYLRVEDVLSEALHIETSRIRSTEQHRVGKILRELGYHKAVRRVNSRSQKVWVLKEVNDLE